MYKKLIAMLLAILMLTVTTTVFAASPVNVKEPISLDNVSHIIHFSDGSQLEICKTILVSQSKTNSLNSLSVTSSFEFTLQKELRYTDCFNNWIWSYFLYPTFSVNYGSSVFCVSTSYSFTTGIGWALTYENRVPNNSTPYFSASATVDVTFVDRLLGIVINTVNGRAGVTCDTFGNYSTW